MMQPYSSLRGKATKEGDYTFVESAELGSMAPWKDKNEPGVTTHAKITAKLDNVNRTDQFFALVLLNNSTGTNAKVAMPSEGDKFSAWNEAKVTDKFATPRMASIWQMLLCSRIIMLLL